MSAPIILSKKTYVTYVIGWQINGSTEIEAASEEEAEERFNALGYRALVVDADCGEIIEGPKVKGEDD